MLSSREVRHATGSGSTRLAERLLATRERDLRQRRAGSDQQRFGVEISGSNDNVVAGNQIGTDLTGTQALGNQSGGVQIEFGASSNTIGGVLLMRAT